MCEHTERFEDRASVHAFVGSPPVVFKNRDTRDAANASTAAAAMASRDLNIGDVNIVLREVSHATTEPLATTLIKTLSTQIGTFATAAPQSLVQLLHCPSSEVAAEVMLTLHDNAGGDDHAASRFMASRFAALLPDDDDAASISPRVIRFMVMLPEVLGRLVRQRFAVPPRPPYQMSAATALGIFLAWNGPGPAPTTQAPWMANLDRDMLRLGDEFGRFVASASPSPADRDAAPVDDSAVCEEDASAPLVHVIEPQLHATITRYGWSPRANALVFLGHRLSLLDSPGADALAAAALCLLPAAAHVSLLVLVTAHELGERRLTLEDADDDDDHEGEGDDGEVEDEDFALVLPVTHVLRRRLGLGLPSCDDASMPPLEGAAADGEDEREAELASGRRPLEASTPYHVDEGGGPTPASDSPLTIAEPELKRTRPYLGEMDLEMDEPDGGAASVAAKVAARVAEAAEAMQMPMEAEAMAMEAEAAEA